MDFETGSRRAVNTLDAPEPREEGTQDSSSLPLHRPVMVEEMLELLDPGPGCKVLDLTVGTGGHAVALARRLGREGLLLGLDADATALAVARRRLSQEALCQVRLVQGRFSAALELAAGERFDVLVADLGVGTHQLDDRRRGFSLDSEDRLDMRFDRERPGPSAWDVVNRFPEQELADLFYQLGQERLSRQIAAAICRARQRAPIETPAQLGQLVKGVAARRSHGRTWRIHPATRVAMALRIYVNDELGELDALLDALPSLLAPGGRAAVLTYHSLEARRVKLAWRGQAAEGLLELLTRRVVKPSEDEVKANPRARSAQLRAARRP